MEQSGWDDLLARLARIEALAERAGTLAEAEAAAAALSRLLLRHNLSLAEVGERRGREPGGVAAQEQRLANGAAWRHYLLHALAQTHLCRAIRHKGNRATLIGHPHNLAAVTDLYRWLSDAIERLAQREWEARRERRAAELLLAAPPEAQPRVADALAAAARETPGKRAWLAAFRTGAVDGIWRRLLDERQKLESETAPDRWALVPLLEREVEAFVGERFARLGSYAVGGGDRDGYRVGHAAGYAIDVGTRQVGAGSGNAS